MPLSNLDAYFAYTVPCGGHLMNISVFYLSRTALVPISRSLRDGMLSWPGREIRTGTLEAGARRSRCLLRLRYHAPLPYL